MHDVLLVENADGAELDAYWYRALEQLLHLLRSSAGGDIPIEVRMPEQCIAHGAADAPGFEARFFEAADDPANSFWRV